MPCKGCLLWLLLTLLIVSPLVAAQNSMKYQEEKGKPPNHRPLIEIDIGEEEAPIVQNVTNITNVTIVQPQASTARGLLVLLALLTVLLGSLLYWKWDYFFKRD